MQRRTVQDPQRVSRQQPSGGARDCSEGGAALATGLAALTVIAAPAEAQPQCDCRGRAGDGGQGRRPDRPGAGRPGRRQGGGGQGRDCALALALQLDSGGSVLPEHQLDDLVQALEGAGGQTGVWIGPSGSRATDEAVRLVAAVDLVGVAGPGRASRSPRS